MNVKPKNANERTASSTALMRRLKPYLARLDANPVAISAVKKVAFSGPEWERLTDEQKNQLAACKSVSELLRLAREFDK